MATWTLNGTGLPLSSTGSNLSGSIPLSGTAPADFSPEGVTEIRIIRSIRVNGLADDSVIINDGAEFRNGNGDNVGQQLGTENTVTSDVVSPATITITPSTWYPTATGNYVQHSSVRGFWASYIANMKNDNATISIDSLTVEIDYAPPTPVPPTVGFSVDRHEVYVNQWVLVRGELIDGVPFPTGKNMDYDGGIYQGPYISSATKLWEYISWPTAGTKTPSFSTTTTSGSDSKSDTVTVLELPPSDVPTVGGVPFGGTADSYYVPDPP